MKIKTVTEFIEKEKNPKDSMWQDFIRTWTPEKEKKPYLTFFKVEV